MKKWILLTSLSIMMSCNAQKKDVFQDFKLLAQETNKTVTVKPGQQIDTAYFRTLFLPSARFTVVGEENGKKSHETMDLNEFISTLTDEYYTKGFTEVSQGMIAEQFEGIAQVMQSFYGEDSDGEKGWGVGTYQFIYSNGRWWISNMVWTMSPKGKEGIPKELLKN